MVNNETKQGFAFDSMAKRSTKEAKKKEVSTNDVETLAATGMTWIEISDQLNFSNHGRLSHVPELKCAFHRGRERWLKNQNNKETTTMQNGTVNTYSRKEIPVDLAELERLASLGLHKAEIAEKLGMGFSTFGNKVGDNPARSKPEIKKAYEKGRTAYLARYPQGVAKEHQVHIPFPIQDEVKPEIKTPLRNNSEAMTQRYLENKTNAVIEPIVPVNSVQRQLDKLSEKKEEEAFKDYKQMDLSIFDDEEAEVLALLAKVQEKKKVESQLITMLSNMTQTEKEVLYKLLQLEF